MFVITEKVLYNFREVFDYVCKQIVHDNDWVFNLRKVSGKKRLIMFDCLRGLQNVRRFNLKFR